MIDVPAGHLYLGGTIDSKRAHRRPGAARLVRPHHPRCDRGHDRLGQDGPGVVLLEEALLAGVPTLIVDPKGDLGNLLLTFPELRPDDFAPGSRTATPPRWPQWKDGLAGWDIEPARIAALRDAAEFTIYTPGSTAGVLNMVGSLPAEGTDEETVADEVEGYVSGLLGVGSSPTRCQAASTSCSPT